MLLILVDMTQINQIRKKINDVGRKIPDASGFVKKQIIMLKLLK